MNNKDLQDALIAWQGGELPVGRVDSLLARLQADPSFRQELAHEVWTLSLAKIAQSPDPRWLILHEELGVMEERFKIIPHTFEESLMQTVRKEPLKFVPAWWRGVAAVAAAAAIVLSALHLVTLEERRHPPARPGILAVLIDATGSRPVSAGPLHLTTGQARLLFTNGVIVDAESPADLELLSVDRMVCLAGRLRTQVPDGAEGFCVETRDGTVTDLGTELGISVSKNGDTDVNVFEGQAEVSVQIPDQQGTRTALLNIHDRARFHSGSGDIHPSSDATFLPRVEPDSPALKLPSDYSARILATGPDHYWRLNQTGQENLHNEIPGAPRLLVKGTVALEADAQGLTSARFKGRNAPGVLYLEKPWATPAAGYAIEFWFMPETLEQMSLAALTTSDPDRPHTALIEIGGRRPGTTAAAGVVRYLLRWPPGHRDGMNLFTPNLSALPYRWHHVVAQQQNGRMELYLDGHLIGPAFTDTPSAPVSSILQLGSLEYRPGMDAANLRRPFAGRIAEVAVYARSLTREEIHAHAQHD